MPDHTTLTDERLREMEAVNREWLAGHALNDDERRHIADSNAALHELRVLRRAVGDGARHWRLDEDRDWNDESETKEWLDDAIEAARRELAAGPAQRDEGGTP